jgi:hypothetical protein
MKLQECPGKGAIQADQASRLAGEVGWRERRVKAGGVLINGRLLQALGTDKDGGWISAVVRVEREHRQAEQRNIGCDIGIESVVTRDKSLKICTGVVDRRIRLVIGRHHAYNRIGEFGRAPGAWKIGESVRTGKCAAAGPEEHLRWRRSRAMVRTRKHCSRSRNRGYLREMRATVGTRPSAVASADKNFSVAQRGTWELPNPENTLIAQAGRRKGIAEIGRNE